MTKRTVRVQALSSASATTQKSEKYGVRVKYPIFLLPLPSFALAARPLASSA
jgi:hypothetical protein